MTKYCLEELPESRHSSRMGCDVLLGDASYVEQCYCNDKDFCNEGSTLVSSVSLAILTNAFFMLYKMLF